MGEDSHATGRHDSKRFAALPIASAVKSAEPSSRIAARKTSRPSSSIDARFAQRASQSAAQESGASLIFSLFQAIPVVPHMYGTECSFFGS